MSRNKNIAFWTFWNAWGFKKKKKITKRVFGSRNNENAMSDLTAAESAPSLSSACSQGVLPLQSLTAARVRRLFPYLGPGGQANAAATGPFSLLITASNQPQGCSCWDHLPLLRLWAAQPSRRSQTKKCWTSFVVYKFLFQSGGRTHIFWLDKL